MSPGESNWPSWVAKADNDLLCIDNNLGAARVPWDMVCYHAQQTAEKMLKAFLVFHGQQPRKTHDLVALLSECLRHDAALSVLSDDADALNGYSIEVRYPPDLYEPGEADGLSAVDAARRVYAAISVRLKPDGS